VTLKANDVLLIVDREICKINRPLVGHELGKIIDRQ